jgi:voltage-gated sodium channel
MKQAAAFVTSMRAVKSAKGSLSNTVVKEEVYYLPHQKKIKQFYLSPTVQITVALIIFMNFVTAAIQSEMLPNEDTRPHRIFHRFEYFYVYTFFIELLVNMYGHYFWEFWYSGWNWFDFIIVIISFLAMYFPDLPAIHVLRLFRAFRVVRVFRQVRKMRRIMEGIMKSLPGLSYAFIAMGLIIGIWAIMGVDFFGQIVFDADGNEDVKLEELGDYYFGTFFRACLSLLQVSTFDSWSSGIARDIIYEKGYGATVYFLSFIFIAGLIMMNVLVALLLDNYLSVDAEENKEPEDITLQPQFVSYDMDNKINFDNSVEHTNTEELPEHNEILYDQQNSGEKTPNMYYQQKIGATTPKYVRQNSGVSTPSAIAMNLAKPLNYGISLPVTSAKDSHALYGILSRIEKRLSAIEDENDQLTAILKKLVNSEGMLTEKGKSFRISSGTTGEVSIERVCLTDMGSYSVSANRTMV